MPSASWHHYVTASLFPLKDILLHTSVLLCLLYGNLPISWAGSLSFQAIKNLRITGMILCHPQKVYLPALFRWQSGHPAKHFCLTTITFPALAWCSLSKLENGCCLRIGATCQQMACDSGLLLIVCCACIISFRLADLSDSFLTLVHVGVWQQACTQHLPEGKQELHWRELLKHQLFWIVVPSAAE